MAKDLLNKYIWIIDTIRQFGRISRADLDECWRRSPYSNGEAKIPRRSFFNYRNAIEELFSVSIQCDPHTYEYYIDDQQQHGVTDWMLNATAISNVLHDSRDVASKIMLEDVPSARSNLTPIIQALRNNRVISFTYASYYRSKPSENVAIEPYFLRIHRQIWYVAGRSVADDKIKTYALDRMSDLQLLTDTFEPPANVTPQEFFRNSFGIMVNQSQPRTIKIKAASQQAKYLRALPLHDSQQEMVGDGYSIFTYKLCITSDLVAELLSKGPEITVLQPLELKTMVMHSLRESLDNYENI